MERINNLIESVAEELSIKKPNIVLSRGKEAFLARQILSHIVETNYPKCVNALARMIHTDISQITFLNNTFERRMIAESSLSETLKHIIKTFKIREEKSFIRNSRLKTHKKEIKRNAKSNRTAQRIFGIKYTIDDELNYLSAIQGSIEYMHRYCQIGRPPILE